MKIHPNINFKPILGKKYWIHGSVNEDSQWYFHHSGLTQYHFKNHQNNHVFTIRFEIWDKWIKQHLIKIIK